MGALAREVPTLHDLKLHEINTPHISERSDADLVTEADHGQPHTPAHRKVLDAAKAENYDREIIRRVGAATSALLLTSARKLNKKRGHASVPYAKAPALMAELHNDASRVARCVEVGILTVTRSQEIRLMEWTEIDFEQRTWLVPGEKMKIKEDGEHRPKDHLVPLTEQALDIIKSMPRYGRYVFPSDHADQASAVSTERASWRDQARRL